MKLDDINGKTCLIGLSYFNRSGELIRQSQLAGDVVAVDAEQGISIALQGVATERQEDKPAVFVLPPTLACWFKAPPGRYRHPATGVDCSNPDFLVTWDIHQTRDETPEGEHEWWEWMPRTAPPQVGMAAGDSE